MTFKFKTSLLLAAALFAGCETYDLERPSEPTRSTAEAELINRSEVVAVVNSVDVATELEQKAARWGYDLKRKESLDGLDLYVLTFDCPPGIDPHVASRELERLQPESTVEANHKYILQTASTSDAQKPSDLVNPTPDLNSSALNASALKTANLRLADVRAPRKYANSLIHWPEGGCDALYNIGILDGGVDSAALSGAASTQIASRAFSMGQALPVAQRHGTAVAEILVGAGRLKNAKLYNAAVMSEDKNGVQFTGVEPMLKALDWMVQSDVRVVNISLAGPYNRTLDRGIQRAVNKGLIIVAAVGNEGADSEPLYPAALDQVIAATAVDSDGNIYNKAVQGQHVDVSAPGVEVFVGDSDTGRYVSGTSIAAPFVAAKIASDARFKTASSTKEVLKILSAETMDLGVRGPDPVYGSGLIQTQQSCN